MLSGTTIELQELIDLRAQVRFNKRRSRTASINGSRLTKIKGRGVDLDEVRLYHTGDDVRNIDWKVTARKNKPHTKIFREEQERPTLIVVDETRSMFFGSQIRFKSIAAAEISALIAWQALEANDRVGAIVVNDGHLSITKPRRSGVTVTHCLSEIAQSANALRAQIALRQVNSDSWSSVPESINNVARSNYRIVIISDMVSLSESTLSKVLRLSRKNRVEIFLVYDNLERTLPPANRYIVEDSEERVSFDTGDQKLRASYRERFDKRVTELVDKCRSHRVEFTKVPTDMPITQLLI
tara:strand:- start:3 stop:893 length:891 start_codon:yes stop_codon:yes gene_type:complete